MVKLLTFVHGVLLIDQKGTLYLYVYNLKGIYLSIFTVR